MNNVRYYHSEFSLLQPQLRHIYTHLPYQSLSTPLRPYSIQLQEMFLYIYDVESIDPWSNIWPRYVYCHSVAFSPKSIFTDSIKQQTNTARTDFYQKPQHQQLQIPKLYQESHQQIEIKKRIRAIRNQLNQAEEVPQVLLEPWELYEVLGIVRRQIRQRGESRMSFITR